MRWIIIPFLGFLLNCQTDMLYSRGPVSQYVTSNPYLGGSSGSSYRHRLDANAVSVARDLIGVPYVYGGKDVNGIDCSGLTSYVYRELGKPIPDGAANQFTAAEKNPKTVTRRPAFL